MLGSRVNWTQRVQVLELLRRQEEWMQGKYWWFQYFEIVPGSYGKMVCWYSLDGLFTPPVYHEEIVFY